MTPHPSEITQVRAAGISGASINQVFHLVSRGLTLEQAIKCVQREFLGIELSPEYFDIVSKRMGIS